MTSNNTNEAPVIREDVVLDLLSRADVYSPDFLAWLTDKLCSTLQARLKNEGISKVILEALSTLEVLHSLHVNTLQGKGEDFMGAAEYVAQATVFIEQLGGDFYKEV